MMLNLNRLRTSLTKHGAHKIALLLERYDKDRVMRRLSGSVRGINIEKVQAEKNLSVDSTGRVPEVWKKARAAGSESIGGLVLIGIIFSHHRLIETMRSAQRPPFRGVIKKGVAIDGKSFTNFAHTIEELGYSVAHTPTEVSYSLARLFEIPGLHKLAGELIALKLKAAGWTGEKSLIEELVDRKLNEVLAISSDQLRKWLATGDLDTMGDRLEDEAFFLGTVEEPARTAGFIFKAGHSPKKTGIVSVAASETGGKAELLHNKLQTMLFNSLVLQYGKNCVGTEQDSGQGTAIDVVVKTAAFCWFYEIKVAKTVKACIRQALPQLLEYAYWRDDSNVADRLYIAAKFTLTNEGESFLRLLRERFNIPVYYVQITQ